MAPMKNFVVFSNYEKIQNVVKLLVIPFSNKKDIYIYIGIDDLLFRKFVINIGFIMLIF